MPNRFSRKYVVAPEAEDRPFISADDAYRYDPDYRADGLPWSVNDRHPSVLTENGVAYLPEILISSITEVNVLPGGRGYSFVLDRQSIEEAHWRSLGLDPTTKEPL